MIGVIAKEADYPAVAEFFELFKTPWEFHRPGVDYDVLICSNAETPPISAKLNLVYGNERTEFDRQSGIEIVSAHANAVLSFGRNRIPIYAGCFDFRNPGPSILVNECTMQTAGAEFVWKGHTVVRLGFDLFAEIRHLLTHGQPLAHAQVPALELHISLVRDLIIGHSIPLVEVPPVPAGHKFVACLTHDVDHPAIRYHKFDHTMFGFLYRATIGSLINFFRGRRSAKELAANFFAAMSLPFVYLGLAKDFWNQFDRYIEIEKGLASTFFFIPTRNQPGLNGKSPAPAMRATRYDVRNVGAQVRRLAAAGHEIGCHGIDAWRDTAAGRNELERIRSATGSSDIGVRSHWLFFDEHSPVALENAGFAYDSTVGYNETVGYRAGTCQAFKPFGTKQFFELPMHVMDTALFYPTHMNLPLNQAGNVLTTFVDNASRFGGALTINWHNRSIAPERLWGAPYIGLVDELKRRNAWFATAGQAVAWFRKRRSARIENVTHENDTIRVRVSMGEANPIVPGLTLRLHCSPSQHVDKTIIDSGEVELSSVR